MNKQQYLDVLRRELRHLEPATVNEIIVDFEEHFAGGLSRGKTEDEITAELGDPAEIARQYLESASVPPVAGPMPDQPPITGPGPDKPPVTGFTPDQPPTAVKTGGRVNEAALVAVILLNIFIGIPVWIALFSTLMGCWAAAGGIGVAAAVLFAVAIVQTGVVSLIVALFGIALTALTVLAVILMVFLTKWLIVGLVKYIQWNKKLVTGGQTA